MINESEFNDLLDELFDLIEERVDLLDSDVDCINNGGVLNLEHPEGGSIVLSRQSATRQLWLAAREGGFHFELAEDGEWHCTRGGDDFKTRLARCSSQQFGAALTLD